MNVEIGRTARDRLQRLAGRFLGERRAATAVEFALLAFPFLLLLFAILESCIAFAAQEVMANATDDIARQFRTGQLKASEVDEKMVGDLLCERMGVIFPAGCTGLSFDLRHFDTFEQAEEVFGRVDEYGFPTEYVFDPGPALSKNVLRVYYRWPVITDIMRKSMSNLPNNRTLLFATQTWQNEPFDD